MMKFELKTRNFVKLCIKKTRSFVLKRMNFAATTHLLDDPAENLLAVSAFNDNGLRTLVDERQDAGLMVRSDFFPGLGWMCVLY